MIKNRLINIFPANPIQTRYLRGIKQPGGVLTSSFTDAIERFELVMKDYKTVYENFLKPLDEAYHD